MTRNSKLLLAGTLAAAMGLTAGFLLSHYMADRTQQQQASIPGFLWPNPKMLRAFSLVDQHGQPFDRERLKGKWTFLFFGYTHCPDVCPVTLAVLQQVAQALRASPKGARDVQIVFVSVDPERDTPARLAEYVRYFDDEFVGATGNAVDLDVLTRQLGIVHMRLQPSEDGNYLVDHTAAILLTDPEARWLAVFSAPHKAPEIAKRYQEIRSVVEG